jgi:hypothetical protein
MGKAALMPYKLLAPLVIARGRDGRLYHHYQGGGSGAHRGPVIEWLNPEQREHFLRKGLVVELSGPEAAAATPPVVERRPEPSPPEDAAGAVPEPVEECIRKLDEADVPSDAGRPTCQKVLRDKGFSYGSETLAAAVKQRKFRAS